MASCRIRWHLRAALENHPSISLKSMAEGIVEPLSNGRILPLIRTSDFDFISRRNHTPPRLSIQAQVSRNSHFGISMRGRVGSGHWAHGTADRGGTVNRCLFSSPVFSGLADTSTRGVVTRRIAEKGKTQGP